MNPRAAGEMVLFLAAAAAGVYGFGRAFQGDGLWFGVSAVALVILAKQMGRIQDRWPRRRAVSRTHSDQTAHTTPARTGSEE